MIKMNGMGIGSTAVSGVWSLAVRLGILMSSIFREDLSRACLKIGLHFGKKHICMGHYSVQSLTDTDLVQLCLTRGNFDDRPFHEIYQRYNVMIWRVCYGYLHDEQDAEEMMQEVFIKVYRSLSQFEGRSSFKTWIYRIASTTCLNEIRRRQRRPQLTPTDVDTMADMLPASQTVETAWQKNQQEQLLAQAFSTLPPESYEILRMKELEQQPYKEIADALDISVSAAKMRVQRARLALQVQYRTLVGEDERR